MKHKMGNRILSFIMAVLTVFTMDTNCLDMMTAYAAEVEISEGDLVLTVGSGDSEAKHNTSTSGDTPSVEYGSSYTLGIEGSDSSDSITIKYISDAEFNTWKGTDGESDIWPSKASAYTAGTDIKPGTYYLGYAWRTSSSYSTSYSTTSVKNAFTVTAATIEDPSDAVLTVSDATWTATWTASSASTTGNALQTAPTYQVIVMRDGSQVGDTISTTATSADITSYVTAYGSYSFTVQATIANTGYASSNAVTCTESKTFSDTVAPVIASYEVGTKEDGTKQLTASASDAGTYIAKYAFSTKTDAASLTDADWTANTETSNTDFTFTPSGASAEGNYYFYASDGTNVEKSDTAISVTRVTYANDYTWNEDKDTQTTTNFYLFEEESVSAKTPTRSGYNGAWYTKEFEGDSKPTAGDYKVQAIVAADAATSVDASGTVQVAKGGSITLYGYWEAQTLKVASKSDDVDKYYDGNASTISYTLEKYDSAAQITWYRKATGAETEDVQITENITTNKNDNHVITTSLSLTGAEESGQYYIKATFGEETLTSEPITVTINKRALALKVDDATITYGDALPETVTFTDQTTAGTGAGLLDGETLETIGITYDSVASSYAETTPRKAGTYSLYVKNPKADNYAITLTNGTLTVAAKPVSTSTESVAVLFRQDGEDEVYDTSYVSTYRSGSAITPTLRLTDSGLAGYDEAQIISTDDYTVVYSNNNNAGTAKATVTFKNNYSGSIVAEYTINKIDPNATVELLYNSTSRTTPYEWTYGENASIPNVNGLLEEGTVTYYYKTNGTGTPTTTMPITAGTHKVYAVIAETDNYKGFTTPEVEFTIKKRTIRFKADDGNFTYDGNAHSVDHATQVGSFAYKDSYQSVIVTGSQTDVGSSASKVNVKMPDAIADNYIIETEDGTLTVSAQPLSNPSTFAWSSSKPGTVAWTAISKTGLDISYNITLYRTTNAGGKETVTSQTTTGTSLDLTSYIIADAKQMVQDHGNADGFNDDYMPTYSATIQVEAKSGTYSGNYSASTESNPLTGKHVAYVVVRTSGDTNSLSEAKIYRTGEDATKAGNSTILIEGESANLTVTKAFGYNAPTWLVDDKTTGSFDFSAENGTENTIKAISLTSTDNRLVTVGTTDEIPIIWHFEADNTADMKQVRFYMDVTDTRGLTSWMIKNDATVPSADDTGWIAFEQAKFDSNDATTWSYDGDDEDDYGYIRKVYKTMDVTSGTYYLFVKDSAGSIVKSTPITIYQINFSNGDSTGNDGSYGGTMPTLYRVQNTVITLPTNTFTRTAYTFKNWILTSSTEGSFNGQSIGDGGAFAGDDNVTFTAQWTNEVYDYTIKYYCQKIADDGSLYYDESDVYDSQALRTTQTGKIVKSSDTSIQRLPEEGFELDSDKETSITITAQNQVLNVYYRRKIHTITYTVTKPNGEAITPAPQSYSYGQTVSELATSTYEDADYAVGYDFVGWIFLQVPVRPLCRTRI